MGLQLGGNPVLTDEVDPLEPGTEGVIVKECDAVELEDVADSDGAIGVETPGIVTTTGPDLDVFSGCESVDEDSGGVSV